MVLMTEEHKFIDEFVEALKLKYDGDHDETWIKDPLDSLWEKFYEKVVELCSKSAAQYGPEKEIMNDLAGVALIAAMLWAREKENMINRLADQLPEDFLKRWD